MKIKHARVLPIAAATLATAAVGFASTAQAFDFKVSGQVDRAVTAVDNGHESDLGFVDNGGDPTQFRFTGSQEMDNNTTLGFTYEISMRQNGSGSWDVNSNDYDDQDAVIDTRKINVWVAGDYGKLTFGKLSAASDGTSEVGYSGTAFIGGGMDWFDYAGGVTMLDKDGNAIGTIGSLGNEFDGFGRQNGVTYTTPSLGGLTLSMGLYDGHAFDFAPRYELAFGNGGKFAIALDYADSQDLQRFESPAGYVIEEKNPRFTEYGGSTSILLPSGFNATLVYKHRDYKGSHGLAPSQYAAANHESNNYFAGLGYRTGKHNFQVNYGVTKDYANAGSKLQQIGGAYVYNWTQGVDLYASYHHFMGDHFDNTTYEDSNGDYIAGATPNYVDGEDVDQIYAGVRLKFL